jgi:hypothetical protein
MQNAKWLYLLNLILYFYKSYAILKLIDYHVASYFNMGPSSLHTLLQSGRPRLALLLVSQEARRQKYLEFVLRVDHVFLDFICRQPIWFSANKRNHRIRQGLHGGQSIRPRCPIHGPRNESRSHACAGRQRFHSTRSCIKCSSSQLSQWETKGNTIFFQTLFFILKPSCIPVYFLTFLYTCLFYNSVAHLFILPPLYKPVYFTTLLYTCLFYNPSMYLFILQLCRTPVYFTTLLCTCLFYNPSIYLFILQLCRIPVYFTTLLYTCLFYNSVAYLFILPPFCIPAYFTTLLYTCLFYYPPYTSLIYNPPCTSLFYTLLHTRLFYNPPVYLFILQPFCIPVYFTTLVCTSLFYNPPVYLFILESAVHLQSVSPPLVQQIVVQSVPSERSQSKRAVVNCTVFRSIFVLHYLRRLKHTPYCSIKLAASSSWVTPILKFIGYVTELYAVTYIVLVCHYRQSADIVCSFCKSFTRFTLHLSLSMFEFCLSNLCTCGLFKDAISSSV